MAAPVFDPQYKKLMDTWVRVNRRSLKPVEPGSPLDLATKRLCDVLDQQAELPEEPVRRTSGDRR